MYLADYHTHTCCSMDSETPLQDEVDQARKLGLHELCTTDHCDLVDEKGGRVHDLDWAPILEQFYGVRAKGTGGLELRLGLELGCAHVDPECARKILSGAELDFVIGSVHNLSLDKGGGDFFFQEYHTLEDCYTALDDYFTSLAALARLEDCYDVLGHIIYPLRYMKEVKGVNLKRYDEQLRDIFTAAIHRGRGIELNTYNGRTLAPWLPVLKLYRELGGEIITVGSDAHRPENIGRGLLEARELLEGAGLRYLTVYKGRTPSFVKL